LNSDISKNFSYLSIGQIIATGFQAGFYLIFASLLEPELYGQMSYIIAIAAIFAAVSRFGLNYSVTVYQAKSQSEIANQLNILALITTGSASLILLSINPYAAILCLGLNFFSMNQHNLLGLKKYKKQMLFAIVKSILIISFPILLYFILEIPGILIGMALSNFVGSLDYFKSLHRKVSSFQDIRKKFKVLINNFGIDASSTFPTILDKLLIVPLFGFLYVGIYQFNIQILFAFGMLPVILHAFFLSEESSGAKHKKFTYFSLIAAVLLTIVSIFVAPTVISEFFPNYKEGIPSLQIMLVSLIPLSISSILNAKMQAKESTKIGLSGIIRIISLMGLIVLLGNEFGLTGLSYAVLFSTSLYAISLYVLYLKTK